MELYQWSTFYKKTKSRYKTYLNQRFGEAMRIAQDHMDSRNFYGWNPSFDKPSCK